MYLNNTYMKYTALKIVGITIHMNIIHEQEYASSHKVIYVGIYSDYTVLNSKRISAQQ